MLSLGTPKKTRVSTKGTRGKEQQENLHLLRHQTACGAAEIQPGTTGPEPLLIGRQTVYFSPIVKTTPIEARMLFWFELFPVK